MRSKTKKMIWAVPLMAVVAAIGALAIFMTQTPNDASAQVTSGKEPPGMVKNLKVEPNTAGTPQEQLRVSWEEPTEGGFVTSYRIDISSDGKRWLSYITDHLDSDLSVVHEGLKAKQTRHFRVFAFNRYGTGPGTDAMGTTTAAVVPEPPTKVAAAAYVFGTDPGNPIMLDLNGDGDYKDTFTNTSEKKLGVDLNLNGKLETASLASVVESAITVAQAAPNDETVIKIEWEVPDDPDGAPVTGFRIEYSLNGTRWHLLTDNAPDVGEYYDRGLLANVSRQYRIYAKNSVGRGAVSDATTGETADSVFPPAVSQGTDNLVIIGLSPKSSDVHLKWVAPADPDGDPVTHYRIQARKPVTSGDENPWKNLHSGKHIDRTTVYNFGGDDLVRAGVPFDKNDVPDGGVLADIRIGAINRKNTNELDSGAVAWVLLSDVPIGDPDMPKRAGTPSVKTDQDRHQGRSGLNITWPAADFDKNEGPSTIGDYPDYNTEVKYILLVDGKALSSELEHGPSDANDTTHALADGGDTTKPGHDDDGLYANQERTYQVYIRNESATTANGVASVTATANDPNADRTATAPSVSIRSFPSRVVPDTTARPKLPGQPQNLSVVADGHTEIKLEWSAPAMAAATPDANCGGIDQTAITGYLEDDGSECGDTVITGYKIERSETGTSGWTVIEAGLDDVEYLDTMLIPDKRYYYRVTAMNSTGYGRLASEYQSDKTHPAGNPTPPGGLVAEADGHTAIKLCWYEANLVDPLTGDSRLDEGLPILGYQISYVNADKTETILVADTSSIDTQYTDMGLMAGQSRTYRVRSITLGGVGTGYTEATGMTMDAMVPGAPTGVTATADSDTAVTVKWTAPTDNGGAPVTGYKVMWKMSSADAYADADMMMTAADADPVPTMLQVTGLTENTAYTFTVKAMNAKGDGPASDAAMATTDASNSAPTVGSAIGTQTVIAGADLMVDMTGAFDDADGDALTYAAMSDDTAIATVAGGSTVTVTGVAAGSAIITVAADDGQTAAADQPTQTFVVNVTAAVLTAPTNLTVEVDDSDPGAASVTLKWKNGANSDRHIAVLFDSDWKFAPSHLATAQDSGDVTFASVPAGTYTAVVISIMDDDQGNAQAIEIATEAVTVN